MGMCGSVGIDQSVQGRTGRTVRTGWDRPTLDQTFTISYPGWHSWKVKGSFGQLRDAQNVWSSSLDAFEMAIDFTCFLSSLPLRKP
ncbi:hypothetical protein F2Q69_00015339 [Brassica cretica]|uniref:Uncharacterized protein n=1 Tax=Brassica cretica TaxID=69181 RepID=A0A8S9QU06_BRACR|nr:hypothetical protein F2Q69_00015339 [Brassica cretica]